VPDYLLNWVQLDLDSFKLRYVIGFAKGPGDLVGLQYRITTCPLTGLTISIAESLPRRILSPGQTLELLEP